MASLTQWTWVWADSRRQWRTWKLGMLQSMVLQRVRHDLATEQQQFRWYNSTDWFSSCSLPLLFSSLLPTFATLLVALKTAVNLLVLDSLLWRCRLTVACLVDGRTGSSLFYFLLILTLCYQLGFSLSLTFHI